MENNEISIFMDTKLDISDKKPEAVKLRNWTRCLVKIEAIKCFPCYVRVTFIRNIENESANLCIRINIPGITVRYTSSRTKDYSYGFFWKQNRKQHRIYFAFDSKQNCDNHMTWLKKSLKNLELHRQQILQTRGNSRNILDFLTLEEGFTEYQNISKRNLQDLLGPLPKVPDSRNSMSWARRISGISGIYEEIPGDHRESRASGIYEEMKLPKNNVKLNKDELSVPPPLPPRERINTYPSNSIYLPRCNTNPEMDLQRTRPNESKEYSTNIGCFGRSYRSESVSEGKVSTAEELFESLPSDKFGGLLKVATRPKKRISNLNKNKNKRNSFSSPDLSKVNPFENFEALDDLSSLCSDVFNSSDYCISAENINQENKVSCNEQIISNIPVKSLKRNLNYGNEEPSFYDKDPFNISSQIQSNFNFSCNSSTINLVGCNMNCSTIEENIVIDDLSGYCKMAPIRKKISDKEHSFNQVIKSDSDKENDSKPCTPIKQKDCECVYENMQRLDITNEHLPSTIEEQNVHQNYSPVLLRRNRPDLIKTVESSSSYVDTEEDYYKTPRRTIISIDEKYPSYYPNSCDTKKCKRNSFSRRSSSSDKNRPDSVEVPHLRGAKIENCENFYISSPQKILDERSKIHSKTSSSFESSLKALKISDGIYSVRKLMKPKEINNLQQENDNGSALMEIALHNIDFKFDDANDIKQKFKCNSISQEEHETNFSQSKRIYQKYSTINSRSTNNNINNCNKLIDIDKRQQTENTNVKLKSPDLNALRKFTTLPRFKKIDFSPLKLKINNVLQRNHADGI